MLEKAWILGLFAIGTGLSIGGCGAHIGGSCEPWIEVVPASTISPVEGDPPGTVLLVRFGPFNEPRTIDSIRLTTVLACDTASPIGMGAWTSPAALPSGDPHEHLAPCEVEVEQRGETFGRAVASLPAPVEVAGGSFVWVARDLDGSCAAVGAEEAAGVESLLWRPDGSGWQAIEGQALLSPVDCE